VAGIDSSWDIDCSDGGFLFYLPALAEAWMFKQCVLRWVGKFYIGG
jgi:hypothetical protein